MPMFSVVFMAFNSLKECFKVNVTLKLISQWPKGTNILTINFSGCYC